MNTNRNRPRIESGFTLIEIMVVVVILGLLATLVVQNVLPQADDAKLTRALADVKTIAASVSLYRLQKGRLPTSLDELATKDEHGNSYLANLEHDPWDNAYVLRLGDRPTDWQVVSLGPDRYEGGGDDISSQ